jgi:hypothetical protein
MKGRVKLAQLELTPKGKKGRAMTSSGPAEPPAAAAAEADAEQRIRQEIKQAREQLGDTVDALAAKADVKARAQSWIAGQSGRVKGTVSQGRTLATAQAATARDRLVKTTARDRQQAAAAAAITLIIGYLLIRAWRNP